MAAAAAPAVSDLVHQTTVTAGSGDQTLASANGKRSFDTAFGHGATTDVFFYYMSNQAALEWEWGTGHMSAATTLVRDTVIASSNANSSVTFSAGTIDVTNDVPAAYQWLSRLTTIASSGTTDLGSVQSACITVSGTTTITSFGSSAATGAVKFVEFSGALLLTHNASALILPGGASITTAAGDCLIGRHEGSGNWRVLAYTKATGKAVVTAIVAADIPAGAVDASKISTSIPPFGFDVAVNAALVCSVSGNALTIALKGIDGNDPSASDPVLIPFRSTTLTTGVPVVRSVTAALSVVVPSGQAVGSSNSTPFRLWIVAIDNAGTVELAVVNCLLSASSIFALIEQNLISTTAIATAPSAGVFYSTTARTSKAFRILGYVEYTSGLATAGTWSAAPDIVQLYGPGVKKPGDIVQRQRTDTGAEAAGTTVVPFDDTIPQNTEGDQYMSQAITPTSAANVLQARVLAQISNTVLGNAIALSLYRDSGANALFTSWWIVPTANYWAAMYLDGYALGTSTSSTTFKARVGGSAAGTTTFNGQISARKYGGVMNSFLELVEIMA